MAIFFLDDKFKHPCLEQSHYNRYSFKRCSSINCRPRRLLWKKANTQVWCRGSFCVKPHSTCLPGLYFWFHLIVHAVACFILLAEFISRQLNHGTKNMVLNLACSFFFLSSHWKWSASRIWIITLHALSFLPSDAASLCSAAGAGSACTKRVCLMPAGSWRARLLDNYPQEYQNPLP